MKTKFTINQRVHLLKATVCIFLIIGFLMSLKLWQTDRLFPHAPFANFPILPTPIDSILLGLVIIGLGWSAYKLNRWIVVGTLSLFLLILLQDQMRWQPWVYMYFLFLLPFALVDNIKLKSNHSVFLTCFQIILIGMYLWSGLHKFTSSFFEVAFPDILKGLFKITDEHSIENLKAFGFLVPMIEVAVAIGLFFKKTRNIAVLFGISTHLFILAYLSPIGIGHNSIVYPWNVALMCLIFLAFYNYEGNINILPKQHRLAIGFSLLFACILPALNWADKWDNYFSFNLYTDNINDLFIAVPINEVQTLPVPIQPYVNEEEINTGYYSIVMNRWAFQELNVPVNPQPRVFKLVSKGFCTEISNSNQLRFLEVERKEPRNLNRDYGCSDL